MKKIISFILIFTLFFSIFSCIQTFKVEAAPSMYQIKTTANLRIRTGPGYNYKVIGVYKENTTVNIYEEANGWLKVYYQGNYRWILGSYTKKIDKNTTTSTNEKTLKVTGSPVNVRSGAGLSYSILTKVYKNQTYTYTETKKVGNITWYRIKVSSSTTGWICGTYVKPVTTMTTATTVTTTGRRFNLTASQRDYIERVVAAEARGERYGGKITGAWGTTYKGMVAVAQVIYDRTACPNNWGTTPYSTAAAKGQFAEPYQGTISKEVKAAVSAVFDYEYRITEKPLYFFCMNNCYPNWVYTKTYVMTIGNHKFYR